MVLRFLPPLDFMVLLFLPPAKGFHDRFPVICSSMVGCCKYGMVPPGMADRFFMLTRLLLVIYIFPRYSFSKFYCIFSYTFSFSWTFYRL